MGCHSFSQKGGQGDGRQRDRGRGQQHRHRETEGDGDWGGGGVDQASVGPPAFPSETLGLLPCLACATFTSSRASTFTVSSDRPTPGHKGAERSPGAILKGLSHLYWLVASDGQLLTPSGATRSCLGGTHGLKVWGGGKRACALPAGGSAASGPVLALWASASWPGKGGPGLPTPVGTLH